MLGWKFNKLKNRIVYIEEEKIWESSLSLKEYI
jgi:hypothetical protein